jgi:hypothetical protein
MAYLVYGKRTQPIWNKNTKEYMGPDARFAALDYEGKRVAKLADAGSFAEKADAEEWIQKKKLKPGVVVEIRKAK